MNTKDAYNDKTHEWDDFKHKTTDFVGFTNSNGLSFYVNGTITDGCKVIMEHSQSGEHRTYIYLSQTNLTLQIIGGTNQFLNPEYYEQVTDETGTAVTDKNGNPVVTEKKDQIQESNLPAVVVCVSVGFLLVVLIVALVKGVLVMRQNMANLRVNLF